MQRAYRKESAGQRMVTRVPIARREDAAGHVRSGLHGERFDCAELVCVLDRYGRLEGVVPLATLLAASADATLGHLMIQPAPSAAADADQELIASIALHHGVSALAVTEASGAFLGVVPAAALIRILRHEHVEDLHRLAGIARETELARHAIEAPPIRRVRDRLPWLAAGLIGSFVATALMAGFENMLKEQIAVVFFVPGLVYLADAVGTQSEAIAVRGLSLSHAGIGTLLGGELRTGGIIGLLLGLAAFIAIWLTFGDARLSLAVSASLLFAVVAAAGLGLLFPWLLQSLGRDPAYGRGPIATVVQDILTLVIYFVVARVVLG